ncbi:MAG: AarF/ABC1/UbiB kinase family protein [Planctomycetota bacterium]
MAIRKIGIIERTYRNVQRYRQILTVLIKYGFGDVIDGLKIEQYLEIGLQMISRKRREKIETLTRAERVRMALEELGVTFVKAGQILATRPDLLDVEFIHELEKLQYDVAPFPFADVRAIVERELRVSMEQVFAKFEEKPLAAASIGQVHKARLIDGTDVVVKVQRPDIRPIIEADLEIMLHLASLMERYLEGWDLHRPTHIVEELGRTFEKEIDYTIEASNLERFARQFNADMTVYVPKVIREASTARVLTMEYVSGVRPSDGGALRAAGLDPKVIAKRGADLIMKQVFIHGFFHADPHPGNLLVLPHDVICYLDFGMMGRIDTRTRESIIDLVTGVVREDEDKATDAVLQLTIYESEPNRRALQRDVADFLDEHTHRPLKDLHLGKILEQLLSMASRHRLRIPPDLFLMLKALSTVESLGSVLDPSFDITAHAAPIVQKLQLERYSPRRISRDAWSTGMEFVQLIREIPGEVRDILRQTKQGHVRIEFEHRGLEPMYSTYDRISNRLAFAILLASLIIGSSLLVLAGVPPKWHEIPVVGLAGFVIAGCMAFRLLYLIWRQRKL